MHRSLARVTFALVSSAASLALYACASGAPDAPAAEAADLVADGGSDCGHPAVVHPATGTTGPFCPFQPDAAAPKSCAPGLHCCDPGSGNAATCAESCPPATDASVDFACDSKTECPSGTTCCLGGSVVTESGACGRLVGANVTGSTCRASCGNAPVVCAQQSDCATGTCTAFKTHGRTLGSCQ